MPIEGTVPSTQAGCLRLAAVLIAYDPAVFERVSVAAAGK
jgi:hypothetical protein